MEKNIKVFALGSENDTVLLALKQALSITGITFIKDVVESDLVVSTSIHDVGRIYNPEKNYAVVSMGEKKTATLPRNVEIFNGPPNLLEILKYISSIEVSQEEEIQKAELLPDAKKILVVDDTLRHRNSAKDLLKGHILTIVDGYELALDALSSQKFDVVLTDLKLPMSSSILSPNVFKWGELENYGVFIMLEAARVGVKHIAIVTDLNHHLDPFSAAFDHFSQYLFNINGSDAVMIHANLVDNKKGETVKDWGEALSRVMSAE